MFMGETDNPNTVIESHEAEATKGDPVYLSLDDKVSPAASPFFSNHNRSDQVVGL